MRNKLLDAAIDECRKYGVHCRYEQCTNRHFKVFIANSPMIVVVGANHASYDVRVEMNVRRDIRKSINLIKALDK